MITNIAHALSVAFVGGVGRIERELVALGDTLGARVEVHDGETRGKGRSQLSALLRRSDVVVLVTAVNSHNAVQIARREAGRTGTAVRIVKFCGVSTARALLQELVAQAA
jgi:phosphoglycerate dehydrogenase-like enzyme